MVQIRESERVREARSGLDIRQREVVDAGLSAARAAPDGTDRVEAGLGAGRQYMQDRSMLEDDYLHGGTAFPETTQGFQQTRNMSPAEVHIAFNRGQLSPAAYRAWRDQYQGQRSATVGAGRVEQAVVDRAQRRLDAQRRVGEDDAAFVERLQQSGFQQDEVSDALANQPEMIQRQTREGRQAALEQRQNEQRQRLEDLNKRREAAGLRPLDTPRHLRTDEEREASEQRLRDPRQLQIPQGARQSQEALRRFQMMNDQEQAEGVANAKRAMLSTYESRRGRELTDEDRESINTVIDSGAMTAAQFRLYLDQVMPQKRDGERLPSMNDLWEALPDAERYQDPDQRSDWIRDATEAYFQQRGVREESARRGRGEPERGSATPQGYRRDYFEQRAVGVVRAPAVNRRMPDGRYMFGSDSPANAVRFTAQKFIEKAMKWKNPKMTREEAIEDAMAVLIRHYGGEPPEGLLEEIEALEAGRKWKPPRGRPGWKRD